MILKSNFKISEQDNFMKTLQKVKESIKTSLSNASDLKNWDFLFGETNISIFYLAEMIDPNRLNIEIILPITEENKNIKQASAFEILTKKTLANAELKICEDVNSAVSEILIGGVAILVDNEEKIICCNIEKIVARTIAEPPTSAVIKGPREGFVENIKINLSLIRHILPSDKLVISTHNVGKYTNTQVAVVYLDDIASKQIVKKVEKLIDDIDIDGIIDSYYISSFLQKNKHSIFKQVGDTEKPDILSAKLLEGRVGIVVDGSPIVLTVPFLLLEDLQDSDDYYQPNIRISFVRFLRLIGVILAVLLPGTYVALQIYHYKILPTEFLVTIMDTTKGIPFTPFLETFFVIMLFEILYEANLRMPRYLGMATSIVGALILGETAVNAGLVSPPCVMVVALSGITFYIVPNLAGQFGLLRIAFAIIGAVTGLYGILVFTVLLISYLCSLDSFETAYMAPLAPYIKEDQKDFLFKKNLQEMKLRPKSIKNNQHNSVREDEDE